MKNLFVILRKNSDNASFDLINKACEKRAIKINKIISDDFDFSQNIKLEKNDGIYRISIDPKSLLVEKFLINAEVKSFYENHLFCIGKFDNVIEYSLVHQKTNLPIIKTVFSLTSDRILLKKYVDYLNGFPLIIKAAGGMHGIGVMKIDSFDSLVSVADYLLQQKEKFILREYIPHKKQARIIVLGDKVIASHENIVSQDFRTNAGPKEQRKRANKKYPQEINDLAIKALKILHYEFGGVDILFDEKTNKAKISEVNFPCFFPKTQEITGIDIAGQMIDYLIKKN